MTCTLTTGNPRLRLSRQTATATPFLTIILISMAFTALPMRAQKLNVAYSFADSPDGANPFQSPVFRDKAGNLYGTTLQGGANTAGTIFKLSSDGKETVLYRFKLDPNGRPPSPESGVIGDDAGNLYGTEAFSGPNGNGSVFKLDPKGKLTVLHAFTDGFDGAAPFGGLVRDASGNLYGTTNAGGDLRACGNGCGTVFKLDVNGKFTVLYTFTGSGDGGIPNGSLVLDSAGNLYGTTVGGGSGQGVVFMVSATGQEKVLYSFSPTGQTDGFEPVAGLARDSEGNLYGTTYYGGGGKCDDGFELGCGVVFKLSKAGAYTVLHSFVGTGADDGGWPTAGLVLSTDGNIYGTASGFARFGAGTLFQISKTGAFSVLHTFSGGKDGARPMATMILDSTGSLYGTTAGGGSLGFGLVFKLVP